MQLSPNSLSRIGCQGSSLTGGRWERVTQKRHKVLIGHLRAPVDIAEKLQKVSGQRSLFAVRLNPKPTERVSVAWNKRAAEDDAESYLREVQSAALAQNKPIALRQGGGADLGICDGQVPENSKSRVRPPLGPSSLSQEQVEELLQAQGWKDPVVLSRRLAGKRGDSHQWVFRAASPVVTADVHATFSYVDGECCLTITAEKVRKRIGGESVALDASRKQRVNKSPKAPSDRKQREVAPTQLDPSSQSLNSTAMDVDSKSGTKRSQDNLEDAETASKPRLQTSQSPVRVLGRRGT